MKLPENPTPEQFKKIAPLLLKEMLTSGQYGYPNEIDDVTYALQDGAIVGQFTSGNETYEYSFKNGRRSYGLPNPTPNRALPPWLNPLGLRKNPNLPKPHPVVSGKFAKKGSPAATPASPKIGNATALPQKPRSMRITQNQAGKRCHTP